MAAPQIASQLGVQSDPDGVQVRPQEDPPPLGRKKVHCLTIEVTKKVQGESADLLGGVLRAAIEQLLEKVEPVAQKLEEIRPSTQQFLFCALAENEKPSWVTFPDPLLQRIAALKVPLQIWMTTLAAESKQVTE